jgi:hypothetical protein
MCVSAIACLQELVLHLICLLYMTTDALTDALTDVCTKCVFYVPDIIAGHVCIHGSISVIHKCVCIMLRHGYMRHKTTALCVRTNNPGLFDA